MRQTNRWHPCLLPDNYQRRLRQDLAEADAVADSATRRKPEAEENKSIRRSEVQSQTSGRSVVAARPMYGG
jgi:hypothetical protein